MYESMNVISRRSKKALSTLADILACAIALIFVQIIFPIQAPQDALVTIFCATLAVGVLASFVVGTNTIVLRSLGVADLKWLLLHALVLTAGYGVSMGMLAGAVSGVSVSLFGLGFGMMAIGARVLALCSLEWFRRYGMAHARVVIYGAGSAGRQLSASLCAADNARPVAFFDDNTSIQGAMVGGLRVFSPDELESFVEGNRIDKILLAIPSLADERRSALRDRLKSVGLPVMELPPYNELITKASLLSSLRAIQTSDLLDRRTVEIDPADHSAAYAGKHVLVSGAGGSIGSELCRQIMQANPASLVMLDSCEFALYSIDMDIRKHANAYRTRIVPILGSVCDRAKVEQVLQDNDIQIVLHAAAYKHVPMLESNPIEAARNNVLGTHILATEAAACGVERFILVSTDKAVRPTNVMGASKRLAELVIQDLQTRHAQTCFSMVRFGNVLGSSGSVIPLFKRQIEEGGPITVTDENITRYFMTIQEASRLVLMAGSFAEGGEVFVLDMGDPVKIDDLARKIVELAGLTVRDKANPGGDIEIHYTGLRPGEKMYEELFEGSDLLGTPHQKIMRVMEAKSSELEIAWALRGIRDAVEHLDPAAFIHVLETMIEGFGQREKRRYNKPGVLAKDARAIVAHRWQANTAASRRLLRNRARSPRRDRRPVRYSG